MKGQAVTNHMRRKDKKSRVTLIQLHTIKGRFNNLLHIIKADPTICYLLETHLTDRNKHWLRAKN
jgi:hypothetical protein